MNTIDIWDWKYRIYLDERTLQQVRQWITQLTPREAEIYEQLLQFYLSFYSFGVLLDLCIESPDRAGHYLEIAASHPEDLIRTPQVLVPYYKRTIRNFAHPTQQSILLHLLTCSLHAREIREEYWALTAALFGSAFPQMQQTFNSAQYSHCIPLPRQANLRDHCDALYAAFFQQITQDPHLIQQFGPCAITSYHQKIVEGTGYGAWWDREISSSGEDELVLYTNNGIVKKDDYLYTILHETYPGHGHFYNTVRADNDQMDHGAMHLIEGWATYCEWHTYPSPYVNAVYHNDMAFLYRSLHYSTDGIASEMYQRKRRQGKTVAQMAPSIAYATQYIGYLEAYYLGALWIELAVRRHYHTPKEFLQMLATHNKGEFFSLWL